MRGSENPALAVCKIEAKTMQHALNIQTLVDQAVIDAIPALRPLLGHKVQMIALDLDSASVSEPEPIAQVTFQQFVSQRLHRPPNMAPVTLEAMDEAIVRGALDENV